MSPLHKVKTRTGRVVATHVTESGEPEITTPAEAEDRFGELNAIANAATDRLEETTTAIDTATALFDLAAIDEEQGRLTRLAFGDTRKEAERAEGYRQSGLLMRLVALVFLAQVIDRNTLADELDQVPWLTAADNQLVQAVWPALTAVANAGADSAAQARAMREFAETAAAHVGPIAAETAHWMADLIEAKAGEKVAR